MKKLISLGIVLCLATYCIAQVQSPSAFLYHPFGKQFIPHHEMVDYFKHVAESADNVVFNEYGRTNEGRPLINIIISAKENMAEVETIRAKHLGDLGFDTGKKGNDKAIVYLSYNVHGNEASGVNAAIDVLHQLARPTPKVEAFLKDAIIIIDPCINPDGYARYANWYHQVSSKNLDATPQTREHEEPWPGGRTNHYLFDLNRDWAWQTQAESKQRMAFYLEWFPHIHSDYHEQHYEDPYYFAPAARPYHELITAHQKDFQTAIGKNNASYFDENGWVYFSKEVFDLLYPSYGDTYPSFCGAIGMTFEQGGSGLAGRSIELPHNDSLTLEERIEHHVTTSLSTIEVAVEQKSLLLDEQKKYFAKARSGEIQGFKNFIIKTDGEASQHVNDFLELLTANKIEYAFGDKGQNISAYSYRDKKQVNVAIQTSDIVVSTSQIQGHLAKVLLEPSPYLEDSLTYDITAWSLLYAFDFEAYATEKKVKTKQEYGINVQGMHSMPTEKPLAILAEWKTWQAAKLLAKWQEAGMYVRSSQFPFTTQSGRHFDQGSLLLMAADNVNVPNFATKAIAIASELDVKVHPVSTGWVEKGNDFGSDKMTLLPTPKVLVVGGEGTESYSFGRVWHYFDSKLDHSVSYTEWKDFDRLSLSAFNTIVIPSSYRIKNAHQNKILEWVEDGGRLILVNRSISALSSKIGVEVKNTKDGETATTFAGRERNAIKNAIYGAIVPVKIDNSHPLGYGLNKTYPSLKTNSLLINPVDNGWNVGTLKTAEPLAGFVGSTIQKSLAGSLNIGSLKYGGGEVVVLVDDPLFRGFWSKGFLVFSNAIFQY